MTDMEYKKTQGHESGIEVFRQIDHDYGPRVRILNDPYSFTLLAALSDKNTSQPAVNHLIKMLYRVLFHVAVSEHLPLTDTQVETRLIDANPEAVWQGPVAKKDTRVVVAALARAGLLPAGLFYDNLNLILEPANVRRDHFMINRETDKAGKVTGACISGCKIGGDIENTVLFIPDPMGATGSSILEVLRCYERKESGRPQRVVLLHLIVTPEYLKALLEAYPSVHIVSLRLDRGLSPRDVLLERPGKRWSEEKGLNENHYIIPGIGGLGEMMNNSWV